MEQDIEMGLGSPVPSSSLAVSGDRESPWCRQEEGREVYPCKPTVLWKSLAQILLKSSPLVGRFGKLLEIKGFF